jgi:hypothetical protein
MQKPTLIGLVCLICLCILTISSAEARIWRVPSDAPNLNLAIEMADPGDVIELAVGRHKLAGREIFLKTGLTIRPDTGLPGSVVVEECACHCDDWRDRPVFVLSAFGGDPVTFEGITFRDFDLSCDHFPNNPVFYAAGGTLNFERCTFEGFYKTAAWYEHGASGRFAGCTFSGGAGSPSVVRFAGAQLVMERCVFRENTWIDDDGGLTGSILRLDAGATQLDDSVFDDNGPLIHLVTVGADATLDACATCFADNLTMWEGRVEGVVTLDCCEYDPVLWEIVGDGQLVILDDPGATAAKSMQVEHSSLTEVKRLFQ